MWVYTLTSEAQRVGLGVGAVIGPHHGRTLRGHLGYSQTRRGHRGSGQTQRGHRGCGQIRLLPLLKLSGAPVRDRQWRWSAARQDQRVEEPGSQSGGEQADLLSERCGSPPLLQQEHPEHFLSMEGFFDPIQVGNGRETMRWVHLGQIVLSGFGVGHNRGVRNQKSVHKYSAGMSDMKAHEYIKRSGIKSLGVCCISSLFDCP